MRSSLRQASWIFGIAGVLAQSAGAQGTACESLGSGGVHGNEHCEAVVISRNGRWLAFSWRAFNILPNDTIDDDVFLRDRLTGALELVSVSTTGTTGNGVSGILGSWMSISDDGRWVAFASGASNLVAGDTNADTDVFVRDRQLGTTERASLGPGGLEGNDLSGTGGVALSGNGRYLAFNSLASNLVGLDTNNIDDVFVLDRQQGTKEIVSLTTNGAQANGSSVPPSISADGRFVCFSSSASNLVQGDTNQCADVFVRDRQLGTTERLSVDGAGVQATDRCIMPVMSPDARWVAFVSRASNLVPGDTNGAADVFVRDRLLGTLERANLSSTGAETHPVIDGTYSTSACVSSDGRYVLFWTTAADVVPGDTNGVADVFLRDRLLGTTERVSVGPAGEEGDAQSLWPALADDERSVAFLSLASNFAAGDINVKWDVFVRDRLSPNTNFCSGDGSATACPCGNAGAPGNGCASSASAQGGRLEAQGGASLQHDTIVLSGSSMPDSAVLYFQGTTRTNGGLGIALGDGLRCASGTIVRLRVKTNTQGASRYPDPGDPPVSAKGLVMSPGTRTYQAWYRNAAPYCTSATYNFTNGVEIVWGF